MQNYVDVVALFTADLSFFKEVDKIGELDYRAETNFCNKSNTEISTRENFPSTLMGQKKRQQQDRFFYNCPYIGLGKSA